VLADRRARIRVDEQGGLVDAGERAGPHPVRLLSVGAGDRADVLAQRDGGQATQRSPVCVDDVVEHQRVRPAVGDDVVHRLHQPVLGRGQRDHAVAQQRRLGQHERPGPVGGGNPLQLGNGVGVGPVGDVDHLPVELDLPADDLDDPPVGEVAEPGAQRGMPVDHLGDRALQRVGVQRPGELGDLLDAVGVDRVAVGVVPVVRVEVHALLQRKQGEHVLQAGDLALQLRDIGRGELGEREVRRREPRHRVVGGDRRKCPQPQLGQRPDLGFVKNVFRPAEARRQQRAVGGVDGDRVDLERPRQRHPRVAVLADVRALGESAEVVEQQRGRHREIRRTGGGR
jgi:hypothetical protein